MACAVSDAEYLEYPFDPPVWTVDRRDYILKEEDRVLVDKDGYMHVPQKPGLGFADVLLVLLVERLRERLMQSHGVIICLVLPQFLPSLK